MVETRARKVESIADDLGKSEIFGNKSGDLLILSWGGTRGACRSAAEALQAKKKKVSHFHIRWINPLPKDLGEVLIKFKNVLMPEINCGQLIKIVRAEYLIDVKGLNLVRGKPISSADIQKAANSLIG
jgi:2-oxoglutarate ferredoxin oxidoreductase subunit alpha